MTSVARVGVRGTRDCRAWLVWESVGLVSDERGSCGSPWDSWVSSMARVKLRTDNRHKLTRRQPTPRARWFTLSCRLSTLTAGPATAGDVGGVWPEGHTAGGAGDAVILGGSSCRGVASWPGLTWHRIHASCRPGAIALTFAHVPEHTVCAQGYFVFAAAPSHSPEVWARLSCRRRRSLSPSRISPTVFACPAVLWSG